MLCGLYLVSLSTIYEKDVPNYRTFPPIKREAVKDVERASNSLQARLRLSSSAWDEFYNAHGEGFFKDRHYLDAEHASLAQALAQRDHIVRILDFGCGVGNAVLPLLENSNARVEYLGLDISPTAVELLNKKLSAFSDRVVALVCALDLMNCNQEEWNRVIAQFSEIIDDKDPKFDFCLMIFTVSAFMPVKMAPSIKRACSRLALGGIVCFRDYLRGDLAEKRFAVGQRLGRNLFVRQDGTLSFFFTEPGLLSLFAEIECDMVCLWTKKIRRLVENRASDLKMYRAWLGAEFVRRPSSGKENACSM